VDFAPRRLKCKAHRQEKRPDPNCEACEALLTNPANRQPRCKACDGKRKRPKGVIVNPLGKRSATPSGATRVRAGRGRRRMAKIPGGPAILRVARHEFKGPPPQGARLTHRKGKSGASKTYPQTQPTEIMRMVSALFTREQRIKEAEDIVAVVQGQVRMVEAKKGQMLPHRFETTVSLLNDDLAYANSRLTAVKAWRDFTSQKIRLFLDHALSTTPYCDRMCGCRNGSSQTSPLPGCKDCCGKGTIRSEKTNHYAVAATAKLKHLKKVLCVTELCAKVKAKTSEANEAFKTLLDNNVGLIRKFRSEKQTSMEQDDAEQGAIMGILDAAIRFNPVKPECYICSRPGCGEKVEIPPCGACAGQGEVNDLTCKTCGGLGLKPKSGGMTCPKCKNPRMMLKTSTADFKTYAYNWSYRNSRARKDTDKRAGVYAPSLDAMVSGDDGETGDKGMILHTNEGSQGLLTMDLKHQISEITDPQQRSVLNYTLAGLSLGEIAQALGVSKASVSKLRDTAYATLRGKLSGYMEDQLDE
jgi:hypothetical protein